MQLQFRSEYKKYISSQRSGDPRSNRLLGDMVKRCGGVDPQAALREALAKKNAQAKGKAAKGCCGNKENTPVQCGAQSGGTMPNMGSANIDKIIQFIEGGAQDEAAFKKAQKKARQKQKKDEERRKREEEEEALRKAEEERIRREQELAEQERIKQELALQKQLKKIQKKKNQQPPPPPPPSNESKSSKKKKAKQQQQQVVHSDPDPDPEPELFEQTIPAMVTIKRIVENNNSPPTVTITLKGSTPDQDKLLYTLVNGHDAPILSPKCTTNENSQKQSQPQQNQQQNNKKQSGDKQKKKTKDNNTSSGGSGGSNSKTNNKTNGKESAKVQTSEIKVQLAIDSSFRKDLNQATQNMKKEQQKQTANNSSNNSNNKSAKTAKEVKKSSAKAKEDAKEVKKPASQAKTSSSTSLSSTSSSTPSHQDIIDIPSIKLPPGITITKVSGPLTNRKSSTAAVNEYPDVPVSKSGVIVVDTEKLIQQQGAQGAAGAGTGATSKKKKKKAKKAAAAAATVGTGGNAGPTVSIVNNQNGQSGGKNNSLGGNRNEPRVLIKSADSSSAPSGMVTLKNPIFHPLTGMQKPDDSGSGMSHMINMNEQATISHGENGMVTIRRPRPVGFMPSNESSISEYLAKNAVATASNAVVPTMSTPSTNIGATIVTTAPSVSTKHNVATVVTANPTQGASQANPPILTPWQMPDTSFSALTEDRKIIRPPSPRGVQWPRSDSENGKLPTPSVLQGLPGIEITRVKTGSPVVEQEYVEPPANVSIIRTGGYKVTENAQNWAYSAQP